MLTGNAKQLPTQPQQQLPIGHLVQGQHDAQIFVADAVEASSKQEAKRRLQDILEHAPDVLEDRDAHSQLCKRCKVEMRIICWQSHTKV